MDHEGGNSSQSESKDAADYEKVKLAVIDPAPQPLGCPPFAGRAGESGEARAFRRFPINAHKPGPKEVASWIFP